MWLLVGLGNPGSRYAGNRHNIGFMAVDAIVRRHDFSGWKKAFKGEVCEGRLGGEKALLLKPQTFMNLSGESVQAAVSFHKVDLDRLVVFYDELDLAPGKVRVKKGGGAGGHNGIRSIDQHLGPEYWRVRLGIGHPGDKNLVSPYVLGNFTSEEGRWLEPFLDAIAQESPRLISGDRDGYMTKVALIAPPPTQDKDKKE